MLATEKKPSEENVAMQVPDSGVLSTLKICTRHISSQDSPSNPEGKTLKEEIQFGEETFESLGAQLGSVSVPEDPNPVSSDISSQNSMEKRRAETKQNPFLKFNTAIKVMVEWNSDTLQLDIKYVPLEKDVVQSIIDMIKGAKKY